MDISNEKNVEKATSIGLDVANDFLHSINGSETLKEKHKSLKSIGFFKNETLLAVAQFDAVRDTVLSEHYSTELVNFASNSDDVSVEAIPQILEIFKKKYFPSDILIQVKSFSLNSELLENFKKNSFNERIIEDQLVYEWANPELTFYTYRITSDQSEKYYYGVSHIKKASATIEDCLNDGYFGSGGSKSTNKFKNWKNKYSSSLKKEVLGLYERKSTAFLEELSLIGDRYKNDKNCLNSTSGGKTGGLNIHPDRYSKGVCEVHGEVSLQGETCMKCAIGKILNIQNCPIHGETKHRGVSCNKCSIQKMFTEKDCSIHGETIFRGKYCIKCQAQDSLGVDICLDHGETTFRWGKCQKCSVSETYSLKNCNIHGEVIHHGKKCVTCENQSMFKLLVCSTHGRTKHQGLTCMKCSSMKLRSLKECETHGLVDHMGNYCSTCNSQKSISVRFCPKHGETNHQGSGCMKCVVGKRQNIKVCEIHGETKHNVNSCYKCVRDGIRARKKSKLYTVLK